MPNRSDTTSDTTPFRHRRNSPLNEDPRYQDLLEKIGLSQWILGYRPNYLPALITDHLVQILALPEESADQTLVTVAHFRVPKFHFSR